jgi:endonuclease/exonuclease/phosphatase family metal-dependent hydrolase
MDGMSREILGWIVVPLIGMAVMLMLVVYAITFHPRPVQEEAVKGSRGAPYLMVGQKLKVLTWNVQYMAGKNYVFWYDLPDHKGPDLRPSRADITQTLSEVARVIRAENPDIVLLQEVDIGAARTDHEDQLARLKELLPADYACSTSAFYWKALFVPDSRVGGSVGLALAVLSKYRIDRAVRYQLALAPANLITRQFNTKRAVLEARLPMVGGGEFVVLCTHLEAFAQGSNTMAREVQQVDNILSRLSRQRVSWVLGGDFNMLPPIASAYDRLPPSNQYLYNPRSEIAPLFSAYQPVPNLEEVSGADHEKWFTHFPNGTILKAPFLTIDYLFFPRITPVGSRYVRQSDTLRISDHLPVVAEFYLGKH